MSRMKVRAAGGRSNVEIVDAQIHTFDADNDRYPWDKSPSFERRKHSTTPFTYDQAVAAMVEAGVDAAVLVIPGTYGNENGYLLEAARTYPDLFAVVGRVADGEGLSERLVELTRTPSVVGTRAVVRSVEANRRWDAGEFEPLFQAAEELAFPICVNAPTKLADLARLAKQHPRLPILLDHLGLAGPPTTPLGPETFLALPAVLELAAHPNVSIKATCVTNLSQENFPFRDIWEPLLQTVRAFGAERVMWGSDITRIRHPYADTVNYVHEIPGLSDADRALIYGENTRRILSWPRPDGPQAMQAVDR